MDPLLRVEHLRHRRAPGPEYPVEVCLEIEALAFEPRTLTLLAGAPGSGAGLLLRLLGLRERPEAGEIFFGGLATAPLEDGSRLELRNRSFGFAFAEPFLLEAFSVAENIAMPLFKISCLDLEAARQRTAELLDFAGLADMADDPAGDLAPLAQHKLALARALANAPQVLLVEDTAPQLPPEDRREIFACLRAVRDTYGLAVVAHIAATAAHAAELETAGADRVLRFEAGRPVTSVMASAPPAAAEEVRAHE